MGIETITSTGDYDLRDVAVGIDIDRCVLNTEVAFDTVASAAAQTTPLTKRQIVEAYQQHKVDRKAGLVRDGFNVVGYLEQALEKHFGYSWSADILPEFIRMGHENNKLLMPGAKELFDELTRRDIHFFLLTYGSWSNELEDPGLDKERSIQWQLGKKAADATLANLYSHVTNHPYKTRFLTQERRVSLREYPIDVQRHWQVMTSRMNLVGNHHEGILLPHDASLRGKLTLARFVIMLDDKPIAFEDGDRNLSSGVLVSPLDMANKMAYQEADDSHKFKGKVIRANGLFEAKDAVIKEVEHLRQAE